MVDQNLPGLLGERTGGPEPGLRWSGRLGGPPAHSGQVPLQSAQQLPFVTLGRLDRRLQRGRDRLAGKTGQAGPDGTAKGEHGGRRPDEFLPGAAVVPGLVHPVGGAGEQPPPAAPDAEDRCARAQGNDGQRSLVERTVESRSAGGNQEERSERQGARDGGPRRQAGGPRGPGASGVGAAEHAAGGRNRAAGQGRGGEPVRRRPGAPRFGGATEQGTGAGERPESRVGDRGREATGTAARPRAGPTGSRTRSRPVGGAGRWAFIKRLVPGHQGGSGATVGCYRGDGADPTQPVPRRGIAADYGDRSADRQPGPGPGHVGVGGAGRQLQARGRDGEGEAVGSHHGLEVVEGAEGGGQLIGRAGNGPDLRPAAQQRPLADLGAGPGRGVRRPRTALPLLFGRAGPGQCGPVAGHGIHTGRQVTECVGEDGGRRYLGRKAVTERVEQARQ